jgi:hypothetical protein
MKILLDMNLPPRWVEFLQHEGFEAVHWSTVGDLPESHGTAHRPPLQPCNMSTSR